MLAEIKMQPDGSYRVRIYNPGDGMLLNHEPNLRGNGKYATFAQYEVPSISATDIDKLLALAVRTPRRFGPGSDPQHIYNRATLLKGSEKPHLNPNDITWQSPQKATDCTVDEGMKQDNRPADNLISIEGDVQKQLEGDKLSDADRQALHHLLDHASQITHQGDNGDIVSTQDFSRLLGKNLQCFGEIAPSS